MESIEKKKLSKYVSAGASIIGHAVFLSLLFVSCHFKPEKLDEPEAIKVAVLEEPAPVILPAPVITPPAPVVTPPKPEPPAPVVTPPKPEPPKPVTPPKPEPPKPVTPPKPEPPKPVTPPKPEPPKPVTPPKPEPPRTPTLEERLAAARAEQQPRAVTPQPARPTESAADIQKRLMSGNTTSSQPAVKTGPVAVTGSLTGTARSQESVNYAETAVKPVLMPMWQQVCPSRGDMGNASAETIDISFTVLENGTVMNPKVIRSSSVAGMNAAGQKILEYLRSQRLPTLPSKGIKAKRLEIVITLEAVRGR